MTTRGGPTHWSVIAHQLLTNLRPDREQPMTDPFANTWPRWTDPTPDPPGEEPHHAAARRLADNELKAAAERNAHRLAADGMDPAEATLVGFGQAAGDQHRLRCPDHSTTVCVDDPGPISDTQAAEERRRILDRLRPRVDPDLEAQAARTVEHLRGDR